MEPNTPTLSNLIFRSKVVSSSKFSSWIPVETPLYSTIGDYDRIKKTPWAQFVKKNFEFTDFVENIKNPNNSFIDLINAEINNSNIILLISENNHVYKNKYINIHPNYNVIEINEANTIGKPKILRIYYPIKCII